MLPEQRIEGRGPLPDLRKKGGYFGRFRGNPKFSCALLMQTKMELGFLLHEVRGTRGSKRKDNEPPGAPLSPMSFRVQTWRPRQYLRIKLHQVQRSKAKLNGAQRELRWGFRATYSREGERATGSKPPRVLHGSSPCHTRKERSRWREDFGASSGAHLMQRDVARGQCLTPTPCARHGSAAYERGEEE